MRKLLGICLLALLLFTTASFADDGTMQFRRVNSLNLSTADVTEAPSRGPVVNQGIGELDEVWDAWDGQSWAVTSDDFVGVTGALVLSDRVITCEWGYQGINYDYFELDIEDGSILETAVFPTDLQGVRDFEWDGTYIYGSNLNNGGNIYRWEPGDMENYELVTTAGTLGRGLALDPETGDFYLSNYDALEKLTHDGNGNYARSDITLPIGVSDMYGIGWMPDEPNGQNIMAFCQFDPDEDLSLNGTVVMMAPDGSSADDGTMLYDDGDAGGGSAGGIAMTTAYNPGWYLVATMCQGVSIDLWEGYPAADMGSLAGSVVEADGGAAIAGATINVFDDEGDLAGSGTSDDQGDYLINNLVVGTYSASCIALGYAVETVNNITITVDAQTDQDFALDDAANVAVSGHVYSVEDNSAVEGAIVRIPALNVEATTSATGAYDLGQQPEGVYEFLIYFDPLNNEYHSDQVFTGIEVTGETDVDFSIEEILAPQNLAAQPASGGVALTWGAPDNHTVAAALLTQQNRLERQAAAAEAEGNLAKFNYYSAELAKVQRRLAAVNENNELDDLSDFVGYRVMVDDEDLGILVEDVMYTVYGITDFDEHSFSVAADYGYGDDNLVWCDEVTGVIGPGYAVVLGDFDYTDIRNTGTMLGLDDDDMSVAISMDGMTYSHYGTSFDEFFVGSNGGISFTGDAFGWENAAIPTDGAPDNFIAPMWVDMDPGDDANHDAWYLVDANNNQIIVQWYTSLYPGPSSDVMDFEAVFDLEENSVTCMYNDASGDGWPTAEAVIGVENGDGTLGLAVNPAVLQDGLAIKFMWLEQAGGVSGTVTECSEEGDVLAGVDVYIDNVMMTTTGDDGTYALESVGAGEHVFRFVLDGYIPVEETVQVPANDALVVDAVMLYPEGDIAMTDIEIIVDVTSEGDSTATTTVSLDNLGCGPLNWNAVLNILETPYSNGAAVTSNPGSNGGGMQFTHSGTINTFASESAPIVSRGPVNVATDELDDLWDLWDGLSYDVSGDEFTGVTGALVLSDRIITCEWGYQGNYGYYEIDFEGNFIVDTDYPADLQGVRDFEWDGTYIYGSNLANGSVYRWLPGEMETSYALVTNVGTLGRGLAMDPETGDFYLSNWDDLEKLTNNGDGSYTRSNITLPAGPASIYGIGWMPNEPNGRNLMLFCQLDQDGDTLVNGTMFFMNPAGTDIDNGYIVYDDDDVNSHMAGGVAVTTDYDAGWYLIATMCQGYTLDLWEGYEQPAQWLYVTPSEGTLDPESDPTELTIHVDLTAEYLGFVPDINSTMGAGELSIEGRVWGGAGPINVIVTVNTDDVAENDVMPSTYALHQNYPNPFNPTTQIRFDLAQPETVKLSVFNVLGQEVMMLANQPMQAGRHALTFDASKLASGLYFYRIEAGNFTDMKKMVLMK